METGGVAVQKVVVVEDCGRIINPLIVDGQIRGGIAQGIGTALFEEYVYDDIGQLQTTTFMHYIVPGSTEVPDIEIHHLVTPSPFTILGIKGMGEGGAISPGALDRCGGRGCHPPAHAGPRARAPDPAGSGAGLDRGGFGDVKIGLLLPSTNTVAETEYWEMLPWGVTAHAGRMLVTQTEVGTDRDYLYLNDQMFTALEPTLANLLTCRPDHLALAMSAMSFVGGAAADPALRQRLEESSGVPVTSGPSACLAAVRAVGASRIGLLSPFQPAVEAETARWFTEHDIEVVSTFSFLAQTTLGIAAIGPDDVRAALVALDDERVEAFVQVGTNVPHGRARRRRRVVARQAGDPRQHGDGVGHPARPRRDAGDRRVRRAARTALGDCRCGWRDTAGGAGGRGSAGAPRLPVDPAWLVDRPERSVPARGRLVEPSGKALPFRSSHSVSAAPSHFAFRRAPAAESSSSPRWSGSQLTTTSPVA